MNVPAVETHHLNFAFDKVAPTLSDVNIIVPANSIYCFLGPNGAGKTTTIRLMLGLIKAPPDSVSLFGNDIQKNRTAVLKRIGSLIEQPSLYGHLTGRENLEVYRLTHKADKKRIAEVLEVTGLKMAANKPAKAYSLGMKQRLSIAIALLHDPELLILDEPVNGLDPQGIIEVRQLITRLHQDFGKTIFVSSHLLSEVEKIATHFGIIHKGRLRFQGPKESLRSTPGKLNVTVDTPDAESACLVLREKYSVTVSGTGSLAVEVNDRREIPVLNELLVHNNIPVYQLAAAQTGLEETFMQITSL